MFIIEFNLSFKYKINKKALKKALYALAAIALFFKGF